jgi:hypothetical protein
MCRARPCLQPLPPGRAQHSADNGLQSAAAAHILCATFVRTAPQGGISGGAGSGRKPGAKKSLRPMGEAGIDTRFKKLVLESTTLISIQNSCQYFYFFKYKGLIYLAKFILVSA